MSDDRAGYRFDLADALNADPVDPAAVAHAYATCLQFGVVVGDDLARRALSLFSAAVAPIAAEIARWAESARTLGVRWVDTDDPWEADALLWPMVHLRTDAENLWALLGDDLSTVVGEFDAALRPEEGLLATLVDTSHMVSYRDRLDPELRNRWWLNAKPDQPDLPPADYWKAVRAVIAQRQASA